jgi:hypothetical protein
MSFHLYLRLDPEKWHWLQDQSVSEPVAAIYVVFDELTPNEMPTEKLFPHGAKSIMMAPVFAAIKYDANGVPDGPVVLLKSCKYLKVPFLFVIQTR